MATLGCAVQEPHSIIASPTSEGTAPSVDPEQQPSYEEYWRDMAPSWAPDELDRIVHEIRKAVSERDLAALLDLVDGDLVSGPRRAYADASTFEQIFGEQWRGSVLQEEAFCAGWRGCALGNGKVWFARPGKDIGIHSITGATPEPRPRIAPEWRFDGRVLGPDCFAYPWISWDNVKAVMERWHLRDRVDIRTFIRKVGWYLGDPITSFEPMDGYGEPLWGEVSKCADTEEAFTIDEDAVVGPPVPFDDQFTISGWYRRIAPIPTVRCKRLAPFLSANCIDASLVETSKTSSDSQGAFGSMGPQSSYGTYGLFMFNGGRHMVLPLKWFNTYNEALNWLDGHENTGPDAAP